MHIFTTIILILGIILIAIGLFMLLRKTTYSKSADGTIVNVYCGALSNKGTCIAQVKYSIGKETYKATIKSSTVLIEDQTVKIYYNPDDPYDAILAKGTDKRVVGGILIGVGALLLLLILANNLRR